MSQTTKGGLLVITATVLLQIGSFAQALPEHWEHHDRVLDGHGRVLDERYNHGHFYPPIGASVHVLPEVTVLTSGAGNRSISSAAFGTRPAARDLSSCAHPWGS